MHIIIVSSSTPSAADPTITNLISDNSDSLFNSPMQSQAPRLPSHNCTTTLPGDPTYPTLRRHSFDEATLRGLNGADATTSTPSMFELVHGSSIYRKPSWKPSELPMNRILAKEGQIGGMEKGGGTEAQ